MAQYAYITLATTKDYLKGAQCLHHILKKQNARYPLIIMVTDNLSEHCNDNSIYNYSIIPYYKFSMRENLRYNDTINKFQAFNFTEYDKLIFIDADMILYENIDYLFEQCKNYEFLAFTYGTIEQYEVATTPNGNLMFLTPNKEIFSDIIDNKSVLSTFCQEDELLLKKYIYPEFQDLIIDPKLPINCFQNLNIKVSFFHDSGEYKYWDFFHEDNFLNFVQKSSFDELMDFFQDWQVIKRVHLSALKKQSGETGFSLKQSVQQVSAIIKELKNKIYE